MDAYGFAIPSQVQGQLSLLGTCLSLPTWQRHMPAWRCHRVQLLGIVAAGFPSPAEEELLDTISLDDYLIPKKEASYLLRVRGDSMINAGILPGDMILVERTANPRDGDIVIAEVDGQWTLKYFRQQGHRVVLEAANPRYPPLVPQQELTIAAVVRAVIRKY